ncbi:MAG: DNA polymerase III subunit gamma/tau [Cryomorphaceae bacterium BACL21 MAG-121220-bin10]|nr:MAG: DNA polymerase III subunit gamma/tau [Cryomorphaceae bacterium BACL21 MAG-121220-bin10]
MEHFIVSARKYRPTNFNDVVGQKAITRTLENAIQQNHLAQALLFTGPRGVGKTTCARILAKKINEDGDHQKDEDFAFNIFELDAASNNSVDDIRSLIEQVRIPPQIGQFKVYIIDEVHMLSSAAFNAFLKTLEEPPKHAIFILATTEKHKIIPTILSRCQIFDFKRITVEDIKGQLEQVAKAEGIEAEEDALHIIAQKADGAMRDALSIFDRVVSFSGKNMTRAAVTENLHVLDYTHYFKMTDAMLQAQIPELLLDYDQILAQGFDGHHFISGLASHFRDLMVAKTPQTVGLMELGPKIQEQYLKQSQATSSIFLMEALAMANTCDLSYKNSRNPRLLVELCLMQLASLNHSDQKKKSANQAYIIPAHLMTPSVASTSAAGSAVAIASTTISDNPKKSSPSDVPLDKIESTKTEKSWDQSAGNPKSPELTPTVDQPPKVDAEDLPTAAKIQEIEGAQRPTLEPVVTPAKKPEFTFEGVRKKTSSLSLKSISEKNQIQEIVKSREPATAVLPESAFTEVAFKAAWSAYATKVEAAGQYNLLSHLTMVAPVLKDTMICLTFPNDTIKIEVEREKGSLLAFLHKELNNHAISLSIDVVESENTRYAYTPAEKFEKLKEKNPFIETLRVALDLEL